MARPPRFDVPGIAQHIVQRGNDRLPCFAAELDYIRYLQDLRDVAKQKRGQSALIGSFQIFPTERPSLSRSNRLQKIHILLSNDNRIFYGSTSTF